MSDHPVLEPREERLLGGKLSVVMRVGDSVRRPGRPWSPEVQRLLGHVRENGFFLVPEPRGFDERGREILSYIEGDTTATVDPWPGSTWSDALLEEVGRSVAAYHRAVRDFVPSADASWQYRPRALLPGEIICHHDFAPYNAVFKGDQLLGIIDWDGAGPGTIQEEVAFLAWQWVPLGPPELKKKLGLDVESDEVARLRLLLDSYGLESRADFIDAVVDRIEISRSGVEQFATEGIPEYVSIRDEGYVKDMEEQIRYLEKAGRRLQAAVE